MTYSVLLTCVGGQYGPELICQLKSRFNDVRVVGVDASPVAVGRSFCDQYYEVPVGANYAYFPTLLEIIKTEKINLVIPTSDEEALVLSEKKRYLEALEVSVACIKPDLLKILSNKLETYKILRERGLQVPDTIELENEYDLRCRLEDCLKSDRDVVLKPPAERGGRGVVVIRQDLEQLLTFGDRREVHCGLTWILADQNRSVWSELFPKFPLMMMDRLVEPVYDLDLLAWRGEPIYVVPRKRVDSAVPNAGHEIVFDQNLIELGKTLIRQFELSWLYDCDVMFDRDGVPMVVEINPRQSGSVAVTEAAGLPIFSDVITLARGWSIPTRDIPYGVKVLPRSTLFRDKY